MNKEKYKTFDELKEELGENYDYKLYKIGISAMEELDKYKNIVDEATNYLLDKYVTGKLDDEEVNNVVKMLKGE